MTCPRFGDGDAGSTVTVRFQNQTVSTVAGSSGKWQVSLSSMAAAPRRGNDSAAYIADAANHNE